MEDDIKCGIGCIRPDSLQCCTTVKYFTFFYSISALMSSTLSVYVASQVTTLEKQFGFTSTQSGFIMSCNDIGYLSVTLFVSYLAEKLHAPRILSLSAILFGVAGIICAAPYFISPSNQRFDKNIQAMNNETTFFSGFMPSTKLCDLSTINSSLHDFSCESKEGTQSFVGVANEFTPVALSLIAIGMIVQGIGKSPRQAFITVFIDNNVPKSQTALYVGFIIAVSIFGPALGFGLGGLFSKIYVTLEDVNISPRDPRWIGAWWIGFLAFGIGSILSAFPVMLFPRRLGKIKSKKNADGLQKSQTPMRKFMLDFLKQVFELLQNKLYIFITVSKCLVLLIVSGGIAFGPKYVETQFSVPAWKANILIGISRIVTTSIGSFIGGLLTSKKKLTPLQCSKLIVFVTMFGVAYHAIGFGVGCNTPEIIGYNKFNANSTLGCGYTCNCRSDEYFPICGSDNKNYLSPCYAGCIAKTVKGFSNCSCINNGGTAVPGLCPTECNMLLPFLILSCMFGLLDAIGIMPGLIFMIRSVRENQKGIAIALHAFLTSLCGWFLGPLVFGEIIDLCCKIWSSKCGAKGSCALYDNYQFRYAIFGISLVIRFIGFVFDLICYLIARNKSDWSTEDTYVEENKIPEKEGFITEMKETAILS